MRKNAKISLPSPIDVDWLRKNDVTHRSACERDEMRRCDVNEGSVFGCRRYLADFSRVNCMLLRFQLLFLFV